MHDENVLARERDARLSDDDLRRVPLRDLAEEDLARRPAP